MLFVLIAAIIVGVKTASWGYGIAIVLFGLGVILELKD